MTRIRHKNVLQTRTTRYHQRVIIQTPFRYYTARKPLPKAPLTI